MAIDFGLKLLLDMYWRSLIDYLVDEGIMKKPLTSEVIGPVEVTIQRRPLRIDYLVRVEDKFLILEVKSGKDIIANMDEYKLMLYSIGVGMRYEVPAHELDERVTIVILVPSRENLRVPIREIKKGIYALKIPFNTLALCVEEAKITGDIVWMTMISTKLRRRLFQRALKMRNFKIIGILLLIDEDIRRVIMSEPREIVREAIRDIFTSLSGEKDLIRGMIKDIFMSLSGDKEMISEVLKEILTTLSGDKEMISEALKRMGELIGYEKLIEIIISIMREVDSKFIKKLKEELDVK